MVLHSWLEAASAGDAQLAAGLCGHVEGRGGKANRYPRTPDVVILPSSLRAHRELTLPTGTLSTTAKEDNSNTRCPSPGLPVFVFGKVIYLFAFNFTFLKGRVIYLFALNFTLLKGRQNMYQADTTIAGWGVFCALLCWGDGTLVSD